MEVRLLKLNSTKERSTPLDVFFLIVTTGVVLADFHHSTFKTKEVV